TSSNSPSSREVILTGGRSIASSVWSVALITGASPFLTLPPRQAPAAACNAASLLPTLRRAASVPIQNRPAAHNLCASDNLQTRPTSKSVANRDGHRSECHKDQKFRAPEIPRCARPA